MKYFKYIILGLFLLLDIYIIYQSSLIAEESSETSSVVTEVVVTIVDTVSPSDESIVDIYGLDNVHNFVRKAIGHFGLFLISSILAYITAVLFLKQKLIIYIIHFIHGLILAITTELIQIFTNGRSGNIKDIFIDYSGYLVGSIIILLIYYIIRRQQERKKIDNV